VRLPSHAPPSPVALPYFTLYRTALEHIPGAAVISFSHPRHPRITRVSLGGGGCVPLLASSEVASWFDDALDYRAFSLVGVPKAALPMLPTLLERLGAAALQAKQVELLRRRPLFLWARAGSAGRHAAATTHGGGGGGGGGGGAFAYDVTMQQLCALGNRLAPLSPPPLPRRVPRSDYSGNRICARNVAQSLFENTLGVRADE